MSPSPDSLGGVGWRDSDRPSAHGAAPEPSTARIIAELQALRIGLALVDGDLSKLPEIMTANRAETAEGGR